MCECDGSRGKVETNGAGGKVLSSESNHTKSRRGVWVMEVHVMRRMCVVDGESVVNGRGGG